MATRSGPAVLSVHGKEDSHSLWGPLVDLLADRGRALGPLDAVVAHSSGAPVAALAMSEGLGVDRAVFIAPPLRADNRWLRHAERLGRPRRGHPRR